MTRFRSSLIALAGAIALSTTSPAAAADFDALIYAAGRGDLAPVEQQLARESSPEARALLRAAAAAARLNPTATRDPLLERIARESSDPAMRRAALSVLTDTAFVNGDYAGAARFARQLELALAEAGQAERAEEVARTRGVSQLLAGSPGQRVEGEVAAASVPLQYDRVGLPRIEVTVNGQRQEAVVDTGANLTVLSRETARRMGVDFHDVETQVGNGVQGTVPVRLGVADRFEIAGTVLRNVAILVIDDEALTFPLPGGYDIRAIVGLPVLRALGRVEIDNDGRFAVAPAVAAGGTGAPLRASGNDLFVEVEVDGQVLPLHLDTGANRTSLSALYAAAHPEVVAGLAAEEARQASAGGMRRAQQVEWRDAPVRIGGNLLRLPEIAVTLPADGPATRFHGTLGSDALRAFRRYAIDFAAMRLELGPIAEPGSAAVPAPAS